jgi:hypothetical protein
MTRQPGLNLVPLTCKYISALPRGQVTNRQRAGVDFQCGNVASDNIAAGVIHKHEAVWVTKREKFAREAQRLGRRGTCF